MWLTSVNLWHLSHFLVNTIASRSIWGQKYHWWITFLTSDLTPKWLPQMNSWIYSAFSSQRPIKSGHEKDLLFRVPWRRQNLIDRYRIWRAWSLSSSNSPLLRYTSMLSFHVSSVVIWKTLVLAISMLRFDKNSRGMFLSMTKSKEEAKIAKTSICLFSSREFFLDPEIFDLH